MKYPGNIREIASLPVDYLGFIFYEKSSRYVGNMDVSGINLPASIVKTGVFVNESTDRMLASVDKYRLDALQLHGHEAPDTCRYLQSRGLRIIKAFSIEKKEDLAQCHSYRGACDYFLFDTRTPQYGGSGRQFDWDILHNYSENIPFFLSGGIGADDAEKLRSFTHPAYYGIDLNSRFEIQPGLKNIPLLTQFIKKIQQSSSHEQNQPIIP